jgi:hypothetical protein
LGKEFGYILQLGLVLGDQEEESNGRDPGGWRAGEEGGERVLLVDVSPK